jgi:hypothetical protein
MSPYAAELRFVDRIVRERFPMVSTRPFFCPDDDVPLVDVFCIPDADVDEFMGFQHGEYTDALEARGFPWIGLLPHRESETQEYYRGICSHVAST